MDCWFGYIDIVIVKFEEGSNSSLHCVTTSRLLLFSHYPKWAVYNIAVCLSLVSPDTLP